MTNQQISDSLGIYKREGNKNNESIYEEFMYNNPRSFYEHEGIKGLANWIREMESTLETHKYAKDCWDKFTTCTFWSVTLIWRNTQVITLGEDASYVTSWEEMKNK